MNALGEGVGVALTEWLVLVVKAAEQEEEAPATTADDMVEFWYDNKWQGNETQIKKK